MARSELDIILRVVDKGSGNLDKFKKSLSAMAIALGVAKVAGEAWQGAIAGAQMAKAEKSFASMAKGVGQDIHKIADAMVEASGEALSMQQSMEMASQAIRLGVAQTPEEFAALTKAATNLGAAMGRGPVEAMGDIVRGIGRMSPLILDNIGIMTNGGKVFEDYGKEIGKTAKELTDAEKKQALLNLAIKDGNALVDAQATGFEKLDAAVKDTTDSFKKELGEALEPLAAGLAGYLREMNDAVAIQNEFGLTMNDMGEYVNRFGEVIVGSKEGLVTWAAGLGDVNARVHDLRGMYSGLVGDIEGATEKIGELTEAQYLEMAAEALSSGNVELAQHYVDMAEAAGKNASNLRDIISALDALNGKKVSYSVFANMTKIQGEDEYYGPGADQQHGGTFTVPQGFPNDSFPVRASSGERVSVDNSERSFFSNSSVNINNGQDIDAFEEMLRQIQ